jgi:DNA helicase-2/ATP-dependent DNA helicase PcrA
MRQDKRKTGSKRMMQPEETTHATLTAALNLLNPAQRTAVEAPERPTLVLAGAGSGKTRVLPMRIARLVANGINPRHILAITFTNKAAREMRERIASLLGEEAGGKIIAKTFHSFGLWMLRTYTGSRAGILDNSDQIKMIKQILQAANMADAPNEVVNTLFLIKDCLQDPDAAIEASMFRLPKRALSSVINAYEKKLEENNLLDFGDLLFKPVQLLKDSHTARQKLRDRFRFVLVDEWQDVNPAQYVLIQLMGAPANPVFVVGDDDQAIYSWRGADPQTLLQFEHDFSGVQIFKLERNYRSTQVIVQAANELIKNNKIRHEKKLYTLKKDGCAHIKLSKAYSGEGEAWCVAQGIREVLDSGVKPKDIAILYRVNAQSRTLEEDLVAMGIPYTIIGGTGFYQRAEIKDLLAYLRFIANPADGMALRRLAGVPPKGIGERTIARLEAIGAAKGLDCLTLIKKMESEDVQALGRGMAAKLAPLAKQLEMIADALFTTGSPLPSRVRGALEHTGLLTYYAKDQDRLDNLEEFVSLAAVLECKAGAETLQDLLDHVGLMTDQDLEQGENTVQLMTLHRAKGLEFECVWVVGIEDGFLPHARSREPEEHEEERRLLYVGLTRAKERLTLSYANCRTVYGREMLRKPSPFLDEIPDELLEVVTATGQPSGQLGPGRILWM